MKISRLVTGGPSAIFHGKVMSTEGPPAAGAAGLCILSTMANPEGPYVKVHFRLESEDDWPPASVESLWAVDQGDGTARLDNIPWFVRGIACGDIVATEPDEEGVRWAGEVVRRSENSTIRLIVVRDGGSEAARQSVLNAFHELGVCFTKVQKLLNHGVAKEWWHVEEGCITARWRAASAG